MDELGNAPSGDQALEGVTLSSLPQASALLCCMYVCIHVGASVSKSRTEQEKGEMVPWFSG